MPEAKAVLGENLYIKCLSQMRGKNISDQYSKVSTPRNFSLKEKREN